MTNQEINLFSVVVEYQEFNMSNAFVKWSILIAIGLLALLSTDLAQAAGPFSIPAGDKSKEIFLDTLFGPLTGGNATSPLTGVITVFNKAMLFVGGILVAYTLIAGTMSTAHDGEMLGKRWSSMWVPIRTALGTAAILPVLPGGFCFAQGVVIWLAMQGVGLADRVFEAYLGSGQELVAGNTFYDPPSIQRPMRQFLENVLIANTCVAAINGSVDASSQEARDYFSLSNIRSSLINAAGGDGSAVTLYYGAAGIPLCGTVTLTQPASTAAEAEGSMGTIFNTAKFSAALTSTHQAEFRSAQAKLETLGAKIANADTAVAEATLRAEVQKTLDDLALHWSTAVRDKAKEEYMKSVDSNFVESIKKDGWLMLGAWYMEIAKAQDAITKGVTTIPNGSTPRLSTGTAAAGGAVVGSMGGIAGSAAGAAAGAVTGFAMDHFVETSIARATSMARETRLGPGGAIQNYGDTSSSSNWTTKIISWFINDDVNIWGSAQGTNLNQNPVMMARNLGQNMTMAGWTAYGLAGAAAVLADQDFMGVGLSGIAAFVAPMVTALAGTIIVSGATLSTYIPMLPYILWIGVALGWAVLLVEAVIGAPLWAVTHLAPDGDGVVGRGGQGYMLVLSLTLRPALMVLGFVSAVILMNPLGLLINSTFVGAFAIGTNPSWFGLTQMIMGCVLYTVTMVSVITRVFALIHMVPDRVLKWIGGGGNEIGEAAHGIESQTAAKVMAGAHVGQQLGSGAAEGLGRVNQRRLQAQGNQKQDVSSLRQAEGNAADLADRSSTNLNRSINDSKDTSNPSLAGQRIEQDQNDSNSGSFNQAVAQAKTAAAAGRMPRASSDDKKDGAAASQFLSRAAQVNKDNPGSVASFIQENGKDTSTPWGKTLGRAGLQNARADHALSELRNKSQPSASPQAPPQEPPADNPPK